MSGCNVAQLPTSKVKINVRVLQYIWAYTLIANSYLPYVKTIFATSLIRCSVTPAVGDGKSRRGFWCLMGCNSKQHDGGMLLHRIGGGVAAKIVFT